MKTFDEWDTQNPINYAQTSNGELSVKGERRKAWRAALIWALVKSQSTCYDVNNCSLIKMMQEELNK